MSPAYDPQTKLFYVTAREQCDIFSSAAQPYEAGHAYYGSAYFPNDDTQPFWGALRAIDPATGKIQWEWKHTSPTWAGVLSTAGGLVFTGDAEGNFIALDAASGKVLWHFQCGASVTASPMSYAIDGKQYVTIAAGSAHSMALLANGTVVAWGRNYKPHSTPARAKASLVGGPLLEICRRFRLS
jgi:alcohol dehydrogenase (cytochrome c)